MEMIKRVKRLVIFIFYDKDGIVDNYVKYYIQNLLDIADRFIIVSNSILNKDNYDVLSEYTKEVYIRDNKGFDGGGYKYVLENVLCLDEINMYDEIVLSNDTCYGPFVSFKTIFDKMDKEDIDFWGIDYQENGPFSYLIANFLVFRNRIIMDMVEYLINQINEREEYIENVYAVFEYGLFQYLTDLGYKMGHYMSDNDMYIYMSPNYRICEHRDPFMKKKCFDLKYYEKDNCIAALKYIEENTEYDIRYIFENIKRLYGIEYNWKYERSRTLFEKKYYFDAVDCTLKEIEDFCRNYPKIYIYGMGIWAHIFLNRFKNIISEFQGFIISDGEEINKPIDGKVIWKSEMTDDMAVIVALGRKNTQEIRPYLGQRKNILYLRNDNYQE